MTKTTERNWLFPHCPTGPLPPMEDKPDMLLWGKLQRSTDWPLDQTDLPDSYVRLPSYEFGAKIDIATTNREGLVLAAKTFCGNPYDGHTLAQTVAQAEYMTVVAAERIYADMGYRGHDYAGEASVMLSGRKRGLSAQMKGELKR